MTLSVLLMLAAGCSSPAFEEPTGGSYRYKAEGPSAKLVKVVQIAEGKPKYDEFIACLTAATSGGSPSGEDFPGVYVVQVTDKSGTKQYEMDLSGTLESKRGNVQTDCLFDLLPPLKAPAGAAGEEEKEE